MVVEGIIFHKDVIRLEKRESATALAERLGFKPLPLEEQERNINREVGTRVRSRLEIVSEKCRTKTT